MSNNKVFFIFHEFDPVNENLLNLIDHASKELNISKALLVYDNTFEKEQIFGPEEKMILINASLENRNQCQYLIDGHSFQHKSEYFLDKIVRIVQGYERQEICWLITNKQYLLIQESPDFKLLNSIVNFIFYLLPEVEQIFDNADIGHMVVTCIGSNEKIKRIDDSVYDLDENSFYPTVLEYINFSTECAIKRIKHMELPDRFAHSMRVAGTIIKMCELNKIEDEDFKYKCYITAIYHDICKNLPTKEQVDIAKKELRVIKYPSTKVLHGPVGAWYLEHKYLFQDKDILNAIKEHTIPSANPSMLVKYIYLADKLELEKSGDFDIEEYKNYWKLIAENKVDDAFDLLLKKSDRTEDIIYGK